MTDLEFETLLPKHSYVFIDGAEPGKRIGLVKRGERGYYLTDCDNPRYDDAFVMDIVTKLNERADVSPDQANAMHIGSLCGWNVPGADPRRYADRKVVA
jgi:hypothetical protein